MVAAAGSGHPDAAAHRGALLPLLRPARRGVQLVFVVYLARVLVGNR
jgi:hypothetical protein